MPVERQDGDLRVLDFHVDQSTALKVEPGAVSAREYPLSIRVGLHATWPAFVDSIRDVLSDRDLYDPELAALAQQIVGEADPADFALRAHRLYSWVLEHIDNNDDLFSQAAVMLRSRSGNRARVLHYMLGLAGIPSRLALVRSAGGDAIASAMADGDTYEHLLVTYEDGKQPIWLFTVERDAPFGYIPPLLRGQPALLLAAGAPKTSVPEGAPHQDLRQLTLDITLGKDGSAHVEAVETLRGTGAVSWRGQLQSIPKPELAQRFEEEYLARLLPGARLGTLRVSGREQEAETLQLHYVFDMSMLGRRSGQSWRCPRCSPAIWRRATPSSTSERRRSWCRCRSTSRSRCGALAQGHAAPEHARAGAAAGRDRRPPALRHDDARRRRHADHRTQARRAADARDQDRLPGLRHLLPPRRPSRSQRTLGQTPVGGTRKRITGRR